MIRIGRTVDEKNRDRRSEADLGSVVAEDVVELVDDDLTECAKRVFGNRNRHFNWGGKTTETSRDPVLLQNVFIY